MRQVERLTKAGKKPEMGGRVFVHWRNAHKPGDRKPMLFAAQCEELRRVLRRDTRLLGFSTRVDLNEKLGSLAAAGNFRRNRGCDPGPVERVNGIEEPYGLCRLVTLQLTDEVKVKVRILRFECRPFRPGFLNAVLAEVPLACLDDRNDVARSEGLADGDERDFPGAPAS